MNNEVTPWIDCEDGSCVRLKGGEVLADVYKEKGNWWASFQTGQMVNGVPLMAAHQVPSQAAGKKFCDAAFDL